MCNVNIYFVQCLLLVKTVTYAIPVSQEDSELEQSTMPNIEPRNLDSDLSESHTNENDAPASQNDDDERFDTMRIPVSQEDSELEQPTMPNIESRNLKIKSSKSHSNVNDIPASQNDADERFDIMKAFKDIDVDVYKEIQEDGQFKTLCWAELFILTENNRNNNMTLSREFSIILESPGDIPKKNLAEDEIVPFELVDGNTKKSKIMNFTTVSRTKEFTIREHKTLFCGAGPILTKEYSEWPKLNKRKLELRLTPTTPTVWQVCRKNVLLHSKSTTDCNSTFDTIATDEILAATASTTKKSPRPHVSQKVKNQKNQIKIKSSKSITFSSETNETSNMLNKFASMPHDLNYRTHPIDINLQLSPENTDEVLQQPEMESEVELLRRNIYFKKINGAEENMSDSITTENNFKLLDNTILFDLIFPDKKVLTSLYNAEVKHKFLINIKIELQHRALNDTNGQEMTDYLVGLEEDSVYHTVPNSSHL